MTTCSAGQALPLTAVALPLRGPEREALESMRIGLQDTLTVTDTYQLSKGKFSVAGNGFQYTATEVVTPGPEAVAYARKNRDFTLPAMLPADSRDDGLLVSGSTLSSIEGVLVHDARGLRVSLQSVPTEASPAFAMPDPADEGTLRVVGMNLYNYFNGDGKGGEFPTPRGAETIVNSPSSGNASVQPSMS